jgi:superoxide dismutase, Cu-Zn family
MKAIIISITFFSLLLVPIESGYGQMTQQMDMKAGIQKAICILYPTQGNNVTGTITFTRTAEGIQVMGDIHGLTPGKHGFHIHEFGDCSAGDGSSAGGHFNPSNTQHGGPMDMQRHEGDMGNVTADSTGNAHVEFLDKMMRLEGPGSVIGRSVVIHKGSDDMKSQPSGNSGPRIACGVIGIAKM